MHDPEKISQLREIVLTDDGFDSIAAMLIPQIFEAVFQGLMVFHYSFPPVENRLTCNVAVEFLVPAELTVDEGTKSSEKIFPVVSPISGPNDRKLFACSGLFDNDSMAVSPICGSACLPSLIKGYAQPWIDPNYPRNYFRKKLKRGRKWARK